MKLYYKENVKGSYKFERERMLFVFDYIPVYNQSCLYTVLLLNYNKNTCNISDVICSVSTLSRERTSFKSSMIPNVTWNEAKDTLHKQKYVTHSASSSTLIT